MELHIAYFYPDQLNLYGDNGNVEVLVYRASKRNIPVSVTEIGLSTVVDSFLMSQVNLIFMGGGPDSGQKLVYQDLTERKGDYLKQYVEEGKTGLFICGAYQLLGNYYKSADGAVLQGLGIYDMYTEHFGNHKPRCIGNTLAQLDATIIGDAFFKISSHAGQELVGFENHGGRTYLGPGVSPLGKMLKGYGNNGEDLTEGVHYKNTLGSYFHGPLLAANPHLADYLIAKALNLFNIKELDDNLMLAAHTARKKLTQ